MTLIDILLKEGWKPHRKLFKDGEFIYEPTTFSNYYSSLGSGNMDYRFLKGGKEVLWGLNERRKPATLHWPTSFIPSSNMTLTDDTIIRYLKDKDPQTVYNQILNHYDNN